MIALLDSPVYGLEAIGQKTMLLRRGANHAYGLQLLSDHSDIPTTSSAAENKALGKAIQGWLSGASCGCHSPAL